MFYCIYLLFSANALLLTRIDALVQRRVQQCEPLIGRLLMYHYIVLNDSKRLLNKKWLRPVISKSNASIVWKAKRNTFLPAV